MFTREFSFNVARLTKQSSKKIKKKLLSKTNAKNLHFVVACRCCFFILRGFYTIFTHNDTDMYIATIIITTTPMTVTAENDGDKFRFRVCLFLLFLLLFITFSFAVLQVTIKHLTPKIYKFAQQQHTHRIYAKKNYHIDLMTLIGISVISFTFTITFFNGI